jgi:hypothetical protein
MPFNLKAAAADMRGCGSPTAVSQLNPDPVKHKRQADDDSWEQSETDAPKERSLVHKPIPR